MITSKFNISIEILGKMKADLDEKKKQREAKEKEKKAYKEKLDEYQAWYLWGTPSWGRGHSPVYPPAHLSRAK